MKGKSGIDLSMDIMEKLPGGFYIKKDGDSFILRRLEAENRRLVDCGSFESYGEAYGGYIDAFALEVVLQSEGVNGDNVEKALEEAKRLIQEYADEYFAEGKHA